MRQDEYFGDVIYEVWCRGGNPNAVDPDSVEAARWRGLSPDEVAQDHVRVPLCDICETCEAVTEVNGFGVCSLRCGHEAARIC